MNETVFSIKNYDKTISVIRPYDDVTINDMVEDFVTLMKGITFYHNQIIDAFKHYIEESEE